MSEAGFQPHKDSLFWSTVNHSFSERLELFSYSLCQKMGIHTCLMQLSRGRHRERALKVCFFFAQKSTVICWYIFFPPVRISGCLENIIHIQRCVCVILAFCHCRKGESWRVVASSFLQPVVPCHWSWSKFILTSHWFTGHFFLNYLPGSRERDKSCVKIGNDLRAFSLTCAKMGVSVGMFHFSGFPVLL